MPATSPTAAEDAPPTDAPAPAPPVLLRNNPEYLTVTKGAKWIGVSYQWLYKMIERGRLRTVRDATSSRQYVSLAELQRIATPVPTRHTAPVAGPPPPTGGGENLAAAG